MDTGLGYSRESKVKKKKWRSIPKQLNVKEWNWKKMFKKRLKKDQSQPVRTFETRDHGHEVWTGRVKAKPKKSPKQKKKRCWVMELKKYIFFK
jgi:hypothetical protein